MVIEIYRKYKEATKMKNVIETLENNRNTLAKYTEWLKTNEVCYLPRAVMDILVRGQRDLEDSIKLHEKWIDESEEEYLHFVDEDFLTYDSEGAVESA